MNHADTHFHLPPAERKHKAELLGAVLAYVSSREFRISYSAIVHDIALQLGVTSEDDISIEVMRALASLGHCGALKIKSDSYVADGERLEGPSFSDEATIVASEVLRNFCSLERIQGAYDEEDAA